MAVIETRRLVRGYGRRRGICGIDLSVPKGSIFGFLGPNGAGKTTAIRVLMGFLQAHDGEAIVLGKDAWRDSRSIKADVGYVRVQSEVTVPACSLLIVATNLYFLYVASGSVAWLVSSMTDRRGLAMAIVLVFLLGTFLLNYLAQLWDPAKSVVFLSPMNYYKPLEILRDGSFPTQDVLKLAAASMTTWSLAGWIFSRRDICTV